MILDDALRISRNQQVVATAQSYSYLELKSSKSLPVGFDRGVVALAVNVMQTAIAGDGETYAIQVIQSDELAVPQSEESPGLPANLADFDVLAERTIDAELLTAGSRHVIVIPNGAITKRYLGARYVVGESGDPDVVLTAYIAPLDMIEKLATYAAPNLVTSVV